MKKIHRVINNIPQHWVGDGFPVRSLFSYAQGNEFDPFLLLDYAGPHEFGAADQKRGVDVHPHKGFETVTILYAGELAHRDSSGGSGTLAAGDVQWMTAGSGVVHEEFHSDDFTRQGGTLEMVQLWVNLPAKDKSHPPRYQDLRDDQFPRVTLDADAGEVRVIAGQLNGSHGPAQTFTPINLWDVQLNADRSTTINVPDGHVCVLVVQQGCVKVDDTTLDAVTMALLERDGSDLRIESQTASRVLMLSGQPIGEPVYGQGPFVMNTREEISQAIQDYQAGKMGTLD